MDRKNIKQHDYWKDGNLCCPFCSQIVVHTDDIFSDATPCIHTEFYYSYSDGNEVELYDEKLQWFFDGIYELKCYEYQKDQELKSSGYNKNHIINFPSLENFIICILGQDKQRIFIELNDQINTCLFSFNPNN